MSDFESDDDAYNSDYCSDTEQGVVEHLQVKVQVAVAPTEKYPEKQQVVWPILKVKKIYKDRSYKVQWADSRVPEEYLFGSEHLIQDRIKIEEREKKLKEAKEKKKLKEEAEKKAKRIVVSSGRVVKKKCQRMYKQPVRRSPRLQNIAATVDIDSSDEEDYMVQHITRKPPNTCLILPAKPEEVEKWLATRNRPDWEIGQNKDDANSTVSPKPGCSNHITNDTIVNLEKTAEGVQVVMDCESMNESTNVIVEAVSPLHSNEFYDNCSVVTEPCGMSEFGDEEDSKGKDNYEVTTMQNVEDMNIKDDCGGGASLVKWSVGFPCDVCDKSLSSRKNLLLHVRNIHKVEPPKKTTYTYVRCVLCGAPMSSKRHLGNHVKLNHPTLTVSCMFCKNGGASFGSLVELEEHVDAHHDSSTVFQCKDCRKYFDRKFCFQRHEGRCVVKKMMAEEKE